MKPISYTIKELKINDDPEIGVHAISFVDFPAIEENFEYFADQLPQYWKWTAAPDTEIIETSHEFCKKHAYTSKDRVYTTKEINAWANYDPTTYAFIPESNLFSSFNGDAENYQGDQQIYNCRHRLQKVSFNDIPDHIKKKHEMSSQINFAIENIEKREVSGVVLKSGQFIYRHDADANGNPGYVYFSRDTIRKLKEKFGYNRNITMMHQSSITGSAILLDSWLDEDDNTTRWSMRYKIVGDTLWEHIKARKVLGFSIESIFVF